MKPSGPPTLGTLMKHYVLSGRCPKCDSATMLDLSKLVAERGAAVPAISLEPILRCPNCQHVGMTISVQPKLGERSDRLKLFTHAKNSS